MTPAIQKTVFETLRGGARSLDGHSDSPRLDAELLLGKILGLTRSALVARGEEPVAGECERSYAGLIEQRRQGAPVAYLTGWREFWSLALRVTPAVLVPRPETEILVELALERLAQGRPSAVLDLGTGSGAVALAIASERPFVQVTGVDISPAALDVAIQNCRSLGLSCIHWRLGSWFEPVRGERFDVIVANPPYVACTDPALETLAAEPRIALCDGPTGLESLGAIVNGAAAHLNEGGWVLLEHGSTQAPEVSTLLESHGFAHIRSHTDLSGRPRVTLASAPSPHWEIS